MTGTEDKPKRLDPEESLHDTLKAIANELQPDYSGRLVVKYHPGGLPEDAFIETDKGRLIFNQHSCFYIVEETEREEEQKGLFWGSKLVKVREQRVIIIVDDRFPGILSEKGWSRKNVLAYLEERDPNARVTVEKHLGIYGLENEVEGVKINSIKD